MTKSLKVVQIVPEMQSGGVERGTVDLAVYLKQHGNIPYVISNGGAMVKELQAHDVQHIKLPVHTKNPLKMLINSWKLYKLFQKKQFDIIHVRSRAPAWSVFLACKLARKAFVTTFHAPYSVTHPIKRFYNSVMLKSDLVIAISKFIAKHIETRYHFRSDKIVIIPRWVDLSKFNLEDISEKEVENFKEKYFGSNLKKGTKLILLPSRYAKWKGHMFLLKALSYLKNKDWVCACVGKLSENNHDYYLDLESRVKELGLDKKVRFFTEAESNIQALYCATDIVVSTSQEPEGFGRTIIEAQAMGKLIVSTSIGTPVEIIVDKKNGFLAPAHDPATFAEVLDKVLNLSEEKIQEITKQAIKNVNEHYSLEKMCGLTVKSYRGMLKKIKHEGEYNVE